MTTLNDQTELIVQDCWFRDEVRLADLTDGPSLIFRRCVFEKGLVAREAKLDRTLMLQECVLQNGGSGFAVDFENARIGGSLILEQCLLEGPFHAAGLRVDNNVHLNQCRIALSLLSIMESIAVGEIDNWQEPLDFNKRALKLDTAINFDQARIERDLAIVATETDKSSPAALIFGKISADQMNLGGNLYLYGTLCVGDVSLNGAHIKGSALTSHHLLNDHGHFRATGSLQFRASVIDGNLSLYQSTVNTHVSLYRTTVGGNIILLGLSTGGDLDMSFANVGTFVGALRQSQSPGCQRPSMIVGGDLKLSGANVNVLELRGADIRGNVYARTGKFGLLILSLGVEPSHGANETYYAKPCTAASFRMSAITVEEDLDISGLQVRVTENEREQERERMLYEGGIVLEQCTIGRDLKFFMDDVQLTLERRWNEPIPWNAVPETWEYSALTWGNLVLRANQVEGNLDLRNVKVEGDLHLNDTIIALNLNIDAGHPIYEGFKTECRNFDADKLECGGDAKLTGLEVRHNFKARAAKVGGDFLFLPRERKRRRSFIPPHLEMEPEEAEDSALQRDYASIGGDLDLTAVTTNHLVVSGANLRKRSRSEEKARISLERVQVGRLEIVRPPLLGTVNLAGVSVHRWAFGDPHQNETQEPTVDSYIDVLSENKPFDRATWIEVETALRNQARDGDANRVYRQMRKTARAEWPVFAKDFTWRRYYRSESRRLRQLRRHPRRWLRTKRRELVEKFLLILWHFWDRIQFVAIGYGTRVWVPMIPTVILFAISLIIFSQAEYVRASPGLLQVLGTNSGGQNQTAQADISPYEAKLNVCPNKDQWSKLDALALTLRYHVPIVSSMTHTWWEAGTKTLPGTGITAERYALIVEVYHWIAWPLFLIGAAALVFRGRQK